MSPEIRLHDPEDRWRLMRVGTDALGKFGTRTERGERITAEWGEPDEFGVYEPRFTVHVNEAVGELGRAFELANRVLDNESLDPDGDLSILARQLLRSLGNRP